MANRTGTRSASKSASAPGNVNKTRSSSPKTARKTLKEELEKAAAGLSHTSESDYPFRFFTLPVTGQPEFNAQGFISCFGLTEMYMDEYKIPIDQVIEERTLDGFFPDLDALVGYYGTGPTDPQVVSEAKRFQRLEALLRKRLKDVKVFRVGKVEVRCFIAGLDKQGDIAGLVTTAIET